MHLGFVDVWAARVMRDIAAPKEPLSDIPEKCIKEPGETHAENKLHFYGGDQSVFFFLFSLSAFQTLRTHNCLLLKKK